MAQAAADGDGQALLLTTEGETIILGGSQGGRLGHGRDRVLGRYRSGRLRAWIDRCSGSSQRAWDSSSSP